jgi:hypothetical protein
VAARCCIEQVKFTSERCEAGFHLVPLNMIGRPTWSVFQKTCESSISKAVKTLSRRASSRFGFAPLVSLHTGTFSHQRRLFSSSTPVANVGPPTQAQAHAVSKPGVSKMDAARSTAEPDFTSMASMLLRKLTAAGLIFGLAGGIYAYSVQKGFSLQGRFSRICDSLTHNTLLVKSAQYMRLVVICFLLGGH